MLSHSAGPTPKTLQGASVKKECQADVYLNALEDHVRAIDSVLDALGQRPHEVESEDDVYWDPAFLPEKHNTDDFDVPPMLSEGVSISRKRERPRLEISSFEMESEKFCVGDCVKLNGSEETLMLGRLASLWVETDGEIMCDVQWFAVPDENTREIRLLSLTDSNPVLSIEKRVRVLDEEAFNEHFTTNMKKQDTFYVVPSMAKQVAKLKATKRSRKKGNNPTKPSKPDFNVSDCRIGHVYPHEQYFFYNARETQATDPWSKDEMKCFIQGLDAGIDYQWGMFAATHVPTRTGVECLRRYQELVEGGQVLDSNYEIRNGSRLAHRYKDLLLDGQKHQVTIDSGMLEEFMRESRNETPEAAPETPAELNPGSAFKVCRQEENSSRPGSTETSPISEVVLDSWPVKKT